MIDFQEDKDLIQRMQRANVRMERLNGDKAQSELKEEKRFEDELDLIPTKDSKSTQRTNPSARSAKSLKNKQHQSYNPDRVKSSIPKAAQQKKNLRDGKYLEELREQEVKRAIRQQEDDQIQQEVIKKLKDAPNEHLHELSNEVALLNRKVEPLLKRVE